MRFNGDKDLHITALLRQVEFSIIHEQLEKRRLDKRPLIHFFLVRSFKILEAFYF